MFVEDGRHKKHRIKRIERFSLAWMDKGIDVSKEGIKK